MKLPYVFVLYGILMLAMLAGSISAQYWFQSGARGGQDSAFNNGASVQIETVYPQIINKGSFGFWVGENLENGAFLQVGYEIVNTSGSYPAYCSPSGCTGHVTLTAGYPTWFWEYFPGKSSNGFYGAVGPSNSVGSFGSFNTYSFTSAGNVWTIYLNGNTIGTVNLNTNSSGAFMPAAFAETANASSNNDTMLPVKFKNFSVYKNGEWVPVSEAYAYIGYGTGSETSLPNLYGVEEVGNYANYFEVGSGLPLDTNRSILWNYSDYLAINSKYGNFSNVEAYKPGAVASISASKYYYISSNERAVFIGWKGSGKNSYTGNSTNASFIINGNVTEEAEWKLQYYLNVTSPYGIAYGSGWYDNGSIANFSIGKSIYEIGYGERAVFIGWNGTGISSLSGSIKMDRPYAIKAEWKIEYEVNATSAYGNATGSGWYDNGSIAHVYAPENISIGNNERMAFVSWGNNYSKNSMSFPVHSAVFLNAIYAKQYLINIESKDAYGNEVYASNYTTSIGTVPPSFFAFAGQVVNVTSAYYKGAYIPIAYSINVSSPKTVQLQLPIYNITLYTYSIMHIPVNASVTIKFENGTTATYYTGSNGMLKVPDVPGIAIGTVYFDGISTQFIAKNGEPVTLYLINSEVFLVIGILAFALIAVVAFKLVHRKRIK